MRGARVVMRIVLDIRVPTFVTQRSIHNCVMADDYDDRKDGDRSRKLVRLSLRKEYTNRDKAYVPK